MKIKQKTVYHILGAIAFLTIPVLLVPRPPQEPMRFFGTPLVRDFLASVCMLGFFYLNYYYLIPKFYFGRRYIVYIAIVLLAFVFVVYVPAWIIDQSGVEALKPAPMEFRNPNFPAPQFTPPGPREFTNPDFPNTQFRPPVPNRTFFVQVRHHIVLFAAVILFSLWLRVQNRLLNIEIGKQSDELNYLKAQMNPHFLFNTLNGIYALAIRERAQLTGTAMLKLSGIMRYIVTESVNTFVLLEKEIAYVNDYIELQKMRMPDRAKLNYQVTGATAGLRIAPHNLMPFIENAFKYGVNPEQDSVVSILIQTESDKLTLRVENTKVRLQNGHELKSGKGIENTKLRLQLLYPERHTLAITESDSNYHVHLTLMLS